MRRWLHKTKDGVSRNMVKAAKELRKQTNKQRWPLDITTVVPDNGNFSDVLIDYTDLRNKWPKRK